MRCVLLDTSLVGDCRLNGKPVGLWILGRVQPGSLTKGGVVQPGSVTKGGVVQPGSVTKGGRV